jgi:hypothetical protein
VDDPARFGEPEADGNRDVLEGLLILAADHVVPVA